MVQVEFEIPLPRDASISLGIYIDRGILQSPIDLSSPSLTASNSAMQKPGSKGMNVTYAHKLLVAGDQQRHGFLKIRNRACLVGHVQRSPDFRQLFRHGSQNSPTGECSMIKKEIFVCDNCSTRTRLNSAERHWCDLCTRGSPLEMRPARDKLNFNNVIAPRISPIPARRRHPHPRVLFGSQPYDAA